MQSFLFIDEGTDLPKRLVELFLQLFCHVWLLQTEEERVEFSVLLDKAGAIERDWVLDEQIS